MTVTLEVEDDVDQVLHGARTGDRPLLGDVTDDDDGHATPLGHPYQRTGDLPHLGDPARGAVSLTRPHRLNRVQHHEGRLGLLDVSQYRPQVGLGGQIEFVSK